MYEELKKLAEGATKSKWTTDGDWDVMSAESDQLNGGYVIAQFQGPDRKINALFCAAANPSAVLALIAENERNSKNSAEWESASLHWMAERDELKAENEALRKDAERYRWLRDKSESVHSFYLSVPIWFSNVRFRAEDVDSSIDIIMGKVVDQ